MMKKMKVLLLITIVIISIGKMGFCEKNLYTEALDLAQKEKYQSALTKALSFKEKAKTKKDQENAQFLICYICYSSFDAKLKAAESYVWVLNCSSEEKARNIYSKIIEGGLTALPCDIEICLNHWRSERVYPWHVAIAISKRPYNEIIYKELVESKNIQSDELEGGGTRIIADIKQNAETVMKKTILATGLNEQIDQVQFINDKTIDKYLSLYKIVCSKCNGWRYLDPSKESMAEQGMTSTTINPIFCYCPSCKKIFCYKCYVSEDFGISCPKCNCMLKDVQTRKDIQLCKKIKKIFKKIPVVELIPYKFGKDLKEAKDMAIATVFVQYGDEIEDVPEEAEIEVEVSKNSDGKRVFTVIFFTE